MAATKLEQDTVQRGFEAAKLATDKLKPLLDSLDISYNETGGVKETLDQAEMDAIDSFSGLTKVQLDDGMYALTATLKTAIDAAYTALNQFSTRIR